MVLVDQKKLQYDEQMSIHCTCICYHMRALMKVGYIFCHHFIIYFQGMDAPVKKVRNPNTHKTGDKPGAGEKVTPEQVCCLVSHKYHESIQFLVK